jgi:hypothetical protein
MIITPWWHFIVLRGEGLPAKMNGRWEDVADLAKHGSFLLRDYGYEGMTFHVTNQWEQRDDGQVAVVVRHLPTYVPEGNQS